MITGQGLIIYSPLKINALKINTIFELKLIIIDHKLHVKHSRKQKQIDLELFKINQCNRII